MQMTMPKHMTPDELIDHAQECYKYANVMRFLGNHANADAALRCAKRAQYRAMEIEAGRPDPAFVENEQEPKGGKMKQTTDNPKSSCRSPTIKG
jgi:hypothetical protein